MEYPVITLARIYPSLLNENHKRLRAFFNSDDAKAIELCANLKAPVKKQDICIMAAYPPMTSTQPPERLTNEYESPFEYENNFILRDEERELTDWSFEGAGFWKRMQGKEESKRKSRIYIPFDSDIEEEGNEKPCEMEDKSCVEEYVPDNSVEDHSDSD